MTPIWKTRGRYRAGLAWAAAASLLLAWAAFAWNRHDARITSLDLDVGAPLAQGTHEKVGGELRPPVAEAEDRARLSAQSLVDAPLGKTPDDPSPRRLRGVTVDTHGRPVADVSVWFHFDGSRGRIPSRATRSDRAGHFELAALSGAFDGTAPRVSREGYSIVRNEAARRDGDGSWLPMRIVLGPVARLRLLARDFAGVALADVDVAVRRAVPAPPEWNAPPRFTATTDAEGRAEFTVPAEAVLAVHFEGLGRSEPATRCEGNRLTHDGRGEALVLLPGETREVEARLGATVELRGQVLLPTLEPVPAARIRILEGPPDEQGWLDYRRELRAYSDGTFHAELRDVDPATELTVIAVDGEFLSLIGEELPAHATSRRISVAAWLNDPRPLELVLDPLAAITGRVVDAAGEPVRSVVWALEPGEPYVLEKGPLDFLPVVVVRGPDPFRLGGLLPGTYDLVVKRDSPRTYHRFPGVRTGAPTREFVIQEDRNVRITIVVEGAREGDSGRPILMRHQVRRPDDFGVPAPGGTIVVDACAEEGWARGRPTETTRPEWTRTTGHPDGRTITRGYSIQAAGVHELDPQQAGCYSVGYLARDRDGRPYARRLSRAYRLDEGEYTFRVTLEPTANLVGAGITGIAPGLAPGLEIEVRDARGHVVLTPSGARGTAVTELGTFRVEQVPLGRLEVRLGTADGLRAGVALRSTSVVVDAAGDVAVAFP